jgi:hypothetical protein
MGFSMAPGFETERKQLLATLRRAAALSAKLDVSVGRGALADQLKELSHQLSEFISYRLEKR